MLGGGQVLIAVVLCSIAAWLLFRAASPKRRARTPAQRRVAAWSELVKLAHDRAVAERLVERMRARHPEIDDVRLVELAIADLRADRRR